MTKQRRAALAAPNLFGIACDVCSRQLVPTQSGYLCCPLGHGRLVADVEPAQDGGGLFAESEAADDE